MLETNNFNSTKAHQEGSFKRLRLVPFFLIPIIQQS